MTLILGIYAALLTVFLLYEVFRKDDANAKLFADCLDVINREESTAEKVKAMASLAELRKTLSPWYQKYLSTIGVIGLFSMTIAAGVQTINSTTQQYRADQLESELDEMKEQVEAAERFVADVSSAIQAGAFDTQRIGEVERRILRYRFDELRSSKEIDNEELSELFSLALVLQEFETAIEALERNKELLDTSNPADRLTLAEYYYLVGSKSAAKEIVDRIEEEGGNHPRAFVKRHIILKLALGGSVEEEAGHLANVFGIRRSDAVEILTREVKILRENRQRLD